MSKRVSPEPTQESHHEQKGDSPKKPKSAAPADEECKPFALEDMTKTRPAIQGQKGMLSFLVPPPPREHPSDERLSVPPHVQLGPHKCVTLFVWGIDHIITFDHTLSRCIATAKSHTQRGVMVIIKSLLLQPDVQSMLGDTGFKMWTCHNSYEDSKCPVLVYVNWFGPGPSRIPPYATYFKGSGIIPYWKSARNGETYVLLVNRWGPLVAAAGAQEKGEDSLDAAMRELYEETKVDVRKSGDALVHLLGFYDQPLARDCAVGDFFTVFGVELKNPPAAILPDLSEIKGVKVLPLAALANGNAKLVEEDNEYHVTLSQGNVVRVDKFNMHCLRVLQRGHGLPCSRKDCVGYGRPKLYAGSQ